MDGAVADDEEEETEVELSGGRKPFVTFVALVELRFSVACAS